MYNDHDGSQDGDINTLQIHSQHRQQEFTRTAECEKLSVEEMFDRVTIPTHLDLEGKLVHRDITHQPVDYDLLKAEATSKVHELPMTLWELRMMGECARLNAAQMAVFEQHWARDLSNAANARPDSRWMISPIDIECLFQVVCDLRGEKEAHRMLTDTIGVNVRWKRDGRIRLAASPTPEIDWDMMVPPPDSAISVTALEDAILEFLQSPYHTDGPWSIPSPQQQDRRDGKWTKRRVTLRNLEEVVDELLSDPSNQHIQRDEMTEEAPFVVRRTALRPEEVVTTNHVKSLNWARQRLGRRGHPHCTYPYIAKAFQVHCEQNGAFFKLDWRAHVTTDGMLCVHTTLSIYLSVSDIVLPEKSEFMSFTNKLQQCSV